MIPVFVKEKQIESAGLTNCGEHTLVCSNCNQKLVNIVVTTKLEQKIDVLATCCFCGDKSFAYNADGFFGFEPYTKENDFAAVKILDIKQDFNKQKTIFTIITSKP